MKEKKNYTLYEQRRRDQARRQKRFPPDRIAFRQNVSAATQDMDDFSDYKNGKLPFEVLCRKVALTNWLDYVFPDGIPEEMMRNELRILGWERVHEL